MELINDAQYFRNIIAYNGLDLKIAGSFILFCQDHIGKAKFLQESPLTLLHT